MLPYVIWQHVINNFQHLLCLCLSLFGKLSQWDFDTESRYHIRSTNSSQDLTLSRLYTLSHWYRTIRVRLVSCLLWGHNRKKYQTTYTLSQTVSSTRCDLCVVNGHVAQKHKQHCAQDVLFATHTFARTKHILCDVKHVLGKRSFSWTPCRGQETQSADWDGNAVPSSCKPWLLSCLWRMTLLKPGFWPSGLLRRKPTKVSD